MSVRRVALLLVVIALAASGCRAWTGISGTARLDENGAEETRRTAAVYAAVIRQLVTKDHTFGAAPSPFERVFVVDGAVAAAGDVLRARQKPTRPFSAAVKREILEALRDLPPVRFVAEPDTVIVGEKSCARVRGEGALISLGPIRNARGGAVTVANSLFIACLGGQWLTYVLEPKDGSWRVLGTKGPIAIS
jgi:hypothetical protein